MRVGQRANSLLAPLGRLLDGMSSVYGRILNWAIDNRLIVGGAATALFAGALYIWPLIGVELEPELDEGSIRVGIELEPGTRVEVTNEVVQQLERIIRESVPEVKNIMSEAGSNSSWRAEGTNEGDIQIELVDRDLRDRSAAEIASALRPKLNIGPGMIIETRIRGATRRRGNDFGEDRLTVEIRGHDMEVSKEMAEQVRRAMFSTPGVVNAQVSRRPGTPEMVVSVDREKAHSMGLSVAEVADTLETAIGGTRASMYRDQGDEYEIVVRLQEIDRLDITQLGEVPLQLPDGSTIKAASIVSLKRREGPFEITRADQQRIIVVNGVIDGRDLGSVVDDLRERLDAIAWPPEYEYRFGGEYEEQQEAFRELTFAAILALILVYMVMASQFESVRDPFIILFSIPLAFVGVAAMLFLSETTFNMQGFLGVIVLVGIVVNNAIVLVDYTNLLRREHGYGLREAVLMAGSRRLRPILMTTVTTVLGLLPMSLGLGEGGELQAPLARVVVGGLTSSTLITLVVIPVVYFTLESWSERGRARAAALEPAHSTGD
jgi:HAE1 family hydrophobic/amphiphilic exporter-1